MPLSSYARRAIAFFGFRFFYYWGFFFVAPPPRLFLRAFASSVAEPLVSRDDVGPAASAEDKFVAGVRVFFCRKEGGGGGVSALGWLTRLSPIGHHKKSSGLYY